jgi:hypothetical protein
MLRLVTKLWGEPSESAFTIIRIRTVAQILERAGQRAAPVAEMIKGQVIKDQVIKSDETSARVEGHNWWQRVFIGDSGVYQREFRREAPPRLKP